MPTIRWEEGRVPRKAPLVLIGCFYIFVLGSSVAGTIGGTAESDVGSIRARLRWVTIATSSAEQTEAFFARLSFARTAEANVTAQDSNSLLLPRSTAVRVALLEMTQNAVAGLRLVSSGRPPREPIRTRARASDYGFYNVAFSARDTRSTRDQLANAGYRCKNAVEYDVPSPARPRIRESLCQGPDLVNAVFLQRVGEQPNFSLRGILSSVRTVADVDRSIALYRVLGFEPRSDYVYDSDGVRHIVELDPGFKLRIVMLESPWPGGARILLFGFLDPSGHPVRGKDLSSKENPKYSGIYLWTFEVEDLPVAIEKMRLVGAKLLSPGRAYSFPPYNNRKAATLQLPDGARIELMETNASAPSATSAQPSRGAP